MDELHPIARAFEEGTPIDEAVREGVLQALREHALLGYPIAEWRDGRVVWTPPDEIFVDEEMTRTRS